MKIHADVKADIDNNIELISLEKVIGKKIKEVQGHITSECGDYTFQLYRIFFEDGSSTFVEGEYDMPYLSSVPSVSDEELESIYKTDPDYEPEEDDEE